MTPTNHLPEIRNVGFIGLGVMGAAQCANVVRRSGTQVHVHDSSPQAIAPLADLGAIPEPAIESLAAKSDLILLSLPGDAEVEAVVTGEGGISTAARRGTIVADLSTVSVGTSQKIAAGLAERGVHFLDAPVARTRQAAIEGTLAMTVGGEDFVFAHVRQILQTMATDIRHCGRNGAGALMKLLNNLVVFQTVVALSEALAVSRASGLVADDTLFEALAAGSAASFVLDHHGRDALFPDEHPVGAFPSRYMLKDVRYALSSAREFGVDLAAGDLAASLLEQTIAAGMGDNYHTAVSRLISRRIGPDAT